MAFRYLSESVGLKRLFILAAFLPAAMSFAVSTVEESEAEVESEEIDDEAVYLDGFVGLGGGLVNQMTEEDGRGDADLAGARNYVHVEFARLRKWVSIDLRAGFGKEYNDFGGLFRVARHWKFGSEAATGISFGAGVGAMYSSGIRRTGSTERDAFVDCVGAPFVRYIWDWGNSMGVGEIGRAHV